MSSSPAPGKRISYSKDELLALRDHPASKEWPSSLDRQYTLKDEKYFSAVRWFAEQAGEDAAKAGDRESGSCGEREARADGVVLGPQRGSFNHGCIGGIDGRRKGDRSSTGRLGRKPGGPVQEPQGAPSQKVKQQINLLPHWHPDHNEAQQSPSGRRQPVQQQQQPLQLQPQQRRRQPQGPPQQSQKDSRQGSKFQSPGQTPRKFGEGNVDQGQSPNSFVSNGKLSADGQRKNPNSRRQQGLDDSDTPPRRCPQGKGFDRSQPTSVPRQESDTPPRRDPQIKLAFGRKQATPGGPPSDSDTAARRGQQAKGFDRHQTAAQPGVRDADKRQEHREVPEGSERSGPQERQSKNTLSQVEPSEKKARKRSRTPELRTESGKGSTEPEPAEQKRSATPEPKTAEKAKAVTVTAALSDSEKVSEKPYEKLTAEKLAVVSDSPKSPRKRRSRTPERKSDADVEKEKKSPKRSPRQSPKREARLPETKEGKVTTTEPAAAVAGAPARQLNLLGTLLPGTTSGNGSKFVPAPAPIGSGHVHESHSKNRVPGAIAAANEASHRLSPDLLFGKMKPNVPPMSRDMKDMKDIEKELQLQQMHLYHPQQHRHPQQQPNHMGLHNMQHHQQLQRLQQMQQQQLLQRQQVQQQQQHQQLLQHRRQHEEPASRAQTGHQQHPTVKAASPQLMSAEGSFNFDRFLATLQDKDGTSTDDKSRFAQFFRQPSSGGKAMHTERIPTVPAALPGVAEAALAADSRANATRSEPFKQVVAPRASRNRSRLEGESGRARRNGLSDVADIEAEATADAIQAMRQQASSGYHSAGAAAAQAQPGLLPTPDEVRSLKPAANFSLPASGFSSDAAENMPSQPAPKPPAAAQVPVGFMPTSVMRKMKHTPSSKAAVTTVSARPQPSARSNAAQQPTSLTTASPPTMPPQLQAVAAHAQLQHFSQQARSKGTGNGPCSNVMPPPAVTTVPGMLPPPVAEGRPGPGPGDRVLPNDLFVKLEQLNKQELAAHTQRNPRYQHHSSQELYEMQQQTQLLMQAPAKPSQFPLVPQPYNPPAQHQYSGGPESHPPPAQQYQQQGPPLTDNPAGVRGPPLADDPAGVRIQLAELFQIHAASPSTTTNHNPPAPGQTHHIHVNISANGQVPPLSQPPPGAAPHAMPLRQQPPPPGSAMHPPPQNWPTAAAAGPRQARVDLKSMFSS